MNYCEEIAAIYLRKSRNDPDAEDIETTLSRHMDTIINLSHKLQLNIGGIYKEVVTGSTLFGRPEMLRLLQDIEQDKYTAIVCMDIDRLGRNSQKDTGIILETLKEHNIKIITPSKTYDLNNDFDEQSVEMQSFLARQEYKSITRRLRRGTEKSCEYGYHIGEPPFGYERIYIDKHPTLKPIPEQAEAVKMIFDMYVNQRYGSYTIANKLNALGIKPRKSDTFSRTTVQFILKNPIYTGKIVWNKRKHIKKKFPTDKHRSVLNPESEWIVSDGIHQPIISQELFDRAQEIIKCNTHPPSYTGELKNVFAELLFCANCGSAIQRQHSSKNGLPARYLCVNNGCTASVVTYAVENFVIATLKQIVHDAKTNRVIKTKYNAKSESQKIAYRTAIAQAEKNLKTVDKQRNKLYDLLEQGVYDTAVFMQRNAALSEKRETIEKELTKYKDLLSKLQDKPDIQELLPVMTYLLKNYDILSIAEKNELYKKLIVRMDYKRTKEQKNNEFSLDIEFIFNT